MIAGVLSGLIAANLAGGAVVLLAAAIRRPVRSRFGARAAYALWLAPLLAAGAVLLPHPARQAPLPPIVADVVATAEVFQAAPAGPHGPDQGAIALAVWLAGAAAAAGLLAASQARFMRSLGRLRPEGGRRRRAEHPGVGPALVGAFRPWIVTPADFEARFGEDERALILAHEAIHLTHGDATANALACALQCACWFNPLAHLGVRLARIDQELACDAAVIERFPAQRRTYAELLLKTQIAAQPLPLGCHWPAGAAHPLKERIVMLKSPSPARAARRLGLAAAAGVALASACAAWAAQPGPRALAEPQPTGPGPEERQEAQARNALHPDYTCDRALELSGGGCKIVQEPVWLALPTHADVMRHYPPAALKAGVTAGVAIHCRMTGEGLLVACAAGETQVQAPPGAAVDDGVRAAFGAAAVAVSRYYQFAIPEGVPGGLGRSRANLTVVFDPASTGREFPPGRPGAGPARAAPAEAGPGGQPIARSPVTGGASIQPVSQVTQAQATPEARLAAYLQSPNWSRRPGAEDLAKVYPAEAQKGRVEGDVVLHCHVAATGKLTDCGVLRETPEGAGFGAAALKLADLFEAREQVPEGGPKRGEDIRLPIRFRLASPHAAAGA
ncbi:MAG: TonB family protein [Phenylobacterium sp.]